MGTRTPTKVLEARGAFRKHPERKREDEPKVATPLGAVPERLNELQAQAWPEIAEPAPTGVLTSADRLDVEVAAKLLAESWSDWEGMSNVDRKMLHTMLGKYGCNPSDRARLSIKKPNDANPFSEF